MSLNSTPSANRLHIGFFGCRNAGKSSLVNAVTDQEVAVVSEVKGTTTDPVQKSMELLPLGPVLIIDTPGYDDEGALGEKRVRKTKQILNRTDLAVLVVDGTAGLSDDDRELLRIFREKKVPAVIACNKEDLMNEEAKQEFVWEYNGHEPILPVSAEKKTHIRELKELLGRMKREEEEPPLVSDLVKSGDFVVLVIPIDESAPKGRLILPQQQVLRDLLDHGAAGVACRETELAATLLKLGRDPALVITDSQVFGEISPLVPEEVPLTSFSILMARYKGFLETAVRGVQALKALPEGAKVLISEGCTHHRQCYDIGTYKIPMWLREYTGKTFCFETSSGGEFPEDLSGYDAVIHCGGCMLNQREMLYRMKCANDQKVPFTNYGIFIAEKNGILQRSIAFLPDHGG